ncbi:hypothetical protein [Agrobacterium burrii]
MDSKPVKQDTDYDVQSQKAPFCGIIMPIADMVEYEPGHWGRVRFVLDEAIKAAGYFPRIVSESEETGVIHGRIVQNLYDDPIVIADVSGRNPNVMFELGMRLAFDKPTIIIKDHKTDYSFDTSIIEHINYRADLRFDDVRLIQERIAAAIIASVEKKKADPEYSPFLKHFHRVKVTELQTEEVGSQQFIIEQIQGVQKEISKLTASVATLSIGVPANKHGSSLNSFAIGLADSTLSKARRMATDAALGLPEYDPKGKGISG